MVVQEFLVFALILMAGVLPVKPCNAGDVKVKIVPTYTAPSSFSLSPPYYRAASSLSLSCEVEGVEDVSSLVYQWTSTCSGSCFTRGSSRRVSTLHGLRSIDSGVHTCVVYDALGCSGTANITIKVVGAGIYVHHGGGRVIPNNSLITTTNPSGRIPRFRCLSGSSTSNVGKLIDPNGKDITNSRSDPFIVSNYEGGSLVVSNVRPLVAADVGIYTCRIPDENGVSVDVNFGLYLSSTSSGPTLIELEESLLSSPSTISCLSRDSPPTDVIWEKDGERIYSNSSSIYQLTQTLVNRKTSTYNNTLTINGTIEDVIGKYCCTASNRLGTSSKLCKSVKAIDISGYESPVIVGLQRDVNCTTFLNVTMMEWVLVGVGEPVERSEDREKSLILTVSPDTTGLNGATFICRVTTADSGKVFEESVTIKVKELQHTVEIGDIQGCPDAGSNFSLNCTVTSDFVPVIKWLYPNSNQVLTSRNDVWVGPPHTIGNTTTLELRFTPLKTAHGGEYVCVSTISKPLSYKRMTKHIKVKITRDGVNIIRDGQFFTTNQLDLTCTTYLNPAVNTPVSVTHTWVGSSGIITSGTNGRTISSVTRYGNRYSSVLRFSSLRSSDSGNYACASSVTSQSTSVCASGLQTTSTSFSAAIRVTIEISYTPPDQYPDYSPPNYRAASSVTLRCVASGTTGSVSYSWSSTCSSCFASSSSSSSISRTILTARDAGVHTCSVRDGIGNTGSNRTTMKIVGAGIYVSTSSSYGGTQAAQPQNSFASLIRRPSYYYSYSYSIRIDMYCCTNSTTSRGTFTIPSGSVYSSNFYNFYMAHHTSGTYAGCTQLYLNYRYTLYLSSTYSGIYTCTRQDSNSNSISVNIGLYSEGFRSIPDIYQLEHSDPQNDSVTFICKTQSAPATDIKWYRDDVRLEIDGDTTQMSTRITSRRSSYTDITLKICDTPENTIGVYTCQVGNKFGNDSETIEIKGLQIDCNSYEFIVGESLDCSCSSDLNPTSIQWFSGSDIYPSQDQDDDTSNTTILSTSNTTIPITTAVRQVYRCSVTSPCGTQQDTITVQNPQVPDDWCRVSISNLGGENALHLNRHSLLCTVTAIPGMTLPPSVEWVGPDGTVLSSGGNMTVGSVNTQGSVSTFSLSFNPVLNSDGGTYTCRAAVHVPWMSIQPRKISTSFDMPVTTQANIQLKMSPLPHCANWDVRKAQDVESSIKRELESAVRKRCDCNFSSRFIFSGEFSCRSTSSLITHVIYRATINGTSDLLTADQIMEHIEDWHESRSTLLYNVFRLNLSSKSECPLTIDSFDDQEC